jgi:hypothetical protein
MLELPARLAGRYRVIERLGHGAIAEVVRALDERTGAQVALKVLYPTLRESPIVVERFRREVDLVRRIEERHVLRIHEVGDSDGFVYLVMDLHSGGDLADRLARKGPLDPGALADLARQLCGALGAAHRGGVVHRDVKPSNVLVGPGRELDVRLCDFGLAQSAEGSGLTTSAAVLGTPGYMAPEVIAEGHADPRSDLYSLGVILFEAATGHLPLSADSPYQLMRLHLEVTPPRPRSLVPDLPPAIDNAIARLLAKDPLDRFPSAEALAWALDVQTSDDGKALASRQPAPPPARGRPCPRCGGWLVQTAAVCADCGEVALRLERQARGLSVMVVGPGRVGHKIDARKQVALFRLLEELPPAWAPRGKGATRAPRFPFYVARNLTAESAERLLARVCDIGFVARIESGAALSSREMRSKVLRLGWRALALFAGAGAFQVSLVLHNSALSSFEAVCSSFVVLGTLGIAISAGRGALLPVVAAPARGARHDPDAWLGQALARLASRQDRRLLARICERLGQLRASALDVPLEPLARRGADLAAALVALEQGEAATSAAGLTASDAQMEIRRVERGRVLLRAELLRLVSRLEGAVWAILGASAQDAATAIAAEVAAGDDLRLAADADRELALFLARRPAGSA